MRYTNQGSRIIGGGDDGRLTLFDSDLDYIKSIYAHDDILSCVLPSPSETNVLLTSSWDSCIKVWDLEVLKDYNSLENFNNAHFGQINDLCYKFNSPSIFVSVGADGFARLWDRRQKSSSTQIINLHQPGSSILYSVDSEYLLITGTVDGSIQAHDIRHVDRSSMLSKCNIHQMRVNRIVTVPNKPFTYLTCSDDTSLAMIQFSDSSSITSLNR